MSKDIELNNTERLILKNQFAILEFLTRAFPDLASRGHTTYHDANTYHWYQDILESFSEGPLIREVTRGIHSAELDDSGQKEALEILEMWGDLQRGFDELEDKGGLTEEDVKFPGWDGHQAQLYFAKLYCFRREDADDDGKQTRPDRFDYVRPSPAYDAHLPVIDIYRRMYEVYAPILKRRRQTHYPPMTAEEIQAILAAQTHPDYR